MKEVICEVVPGLTFDGVVVSEFFHPIREVVRCKDCKHRHSLTGTCVNIDGVCFQNYVADDWFCADGERK